MWPSRNTPDLICQTIGIKDWYSWIPQKITSNSEHLEVIKSLETEGYRIKVTLKNLREIDYPEYKYFVTIYLIKNAIQKRDIDIPERNFHVARFSSTWPRNVHQMYFLEYLAFYFATTILSMNLSPYWAKDPVGQTAYCEFFVDVDNLKGYYGAVMEEYHKYKRNPKAFAFYHWHDVMNAIYKMAGVEEHTVSL